MQINLPCQQIQKYLKEIIVIDQSDLLQNYCATWERETERIQKKLKDSMAYEK